VLHGTDDAFCPPGNADLLVAGIPGAALQLFEGARHAYFLEHRPAASAAVFAHLAIHPMKIR
jgi:pimeloyl-ACP methyl ester carboxylesterase